MHSITIRASEQRVSCVRINEDGDILFTAGADGLVTAWRLDTGARLGTYHYVQEAPFSWTLADLRAELTRSTKAVTWLDVNRDSTSLAVCRFDMVFIYDVASGRLTDVIQENTKVECCEWCQDPRGQDKLVLGVTRVGGAGSDGEPPTPSVRVYQCEDLNAPGKFEGQRHWRCIRDIREFDGGNPTVVAWGPLDQFVVCGTEGGLLYMWDVETGKVVHMRKAHREPVASISFNKSRSVLLTASTDRWAKLRNTLTFETIREIQTDRPLRACGINPLFDHPDPAKRRPVLLLSGGQAAEDVTTTAAAEGHFEVLRYDATTGDEIDRALLHYSPPVRLAWHPDGQIFATGAWEGNAKIVFAA